MPPTTKPDQGVLDALARVKPGEMVLSPGSDFVPQKMGERGLVLPIGPPDGGSRGFELRRPDSSVMLELGAVRSDRALRATPGRHVSELLARSLVSLADKLLAASGEDLRPLVVAAPPVIDVVYVVWWNAWERGVLSRPRSQPSGRLACPSCGHALKELRFVVEDSIFPVWDQAKGKPRAVVGLSEPARLPGGPISKLVLGPPSWHRALWGLSSKEIDNAAAVDFATIAAAVVAGEDGIEGGVLGSLAPKMIAGAGIHERDIALLSAAAGNVGGDVQVAVPVVCPTCNERSLVGFGWADLGFT